VGGDVKEAGSPAPAIEVGAAEKVLLSMAGNLRRSSRFDVVFGDSSPITFPYFLQSNQKQLVFFLRPRN
ncbi:hypothetical protein L9G74_20150, partial [Shewanella sp. C32]|nr:hypothetical protein [Shewanella electrica]